jgi:anti-sigma-K factor RskA
MVREDFNGMQEGHVYDLLPGFALGCLDAPEARQVREHLAICEQCRAELERYAWVVDELPLALEMSEPPVDLKARILTRARQPRQAIQPSVSRWERFRQSALRSAPVWGLASLALVLVLAVNNLLLWQRLGQVEVTGPQVMRSVVLAGTGTAPGSSGRVVISRDGEYGVLVVDGLPRLDAAQQYQLWLIQDGQRTSGGIFSVNRAGYGWLYIKSPDPLASYQAVGITIEPAGGSPRPTGDKVLGGDL